MKDLVQVKSVENKIRLVERFKVVIRPTRGKKLPKSARRYIPKKGAKSAWKVSRWKRDRFGRRYRNLECDVLNYDGDTVRDDMLLANLRATYIE